MSRWIPFALLIFAINFAWEMVQAGLFATMKAMPLWEGTQRCFIAALGDVVIAAIAFLVAAAVARNIEWPVANRRLFLSVILFLIVSIGIAVIEEVRALATGRWQYDERMPLVFGLGATPLLQWTMVPLIAVAVFRYVWKRRAEA